MEKENVQTNLFFVCVQFSTESVGRTNTWLQGGEYSNTPNTTHREHTKLW